MRTALLFMLSLLSAHAEPVLTPVFRPASNHLGVAAYWMQPANEIWISEWSTNLVAWHRTGNETVYDTGLRFTETGLGWTHQLFFRLRRLP